MILFCPSALSRCDDSAAEQVVAERPEDADRQTVLGCLLGSAPLRHSLLAGAGQLHSLLLGTCSDTAPFYPPACVSTVTPHVSIPWQSTVLASVTGVLAAQGHRTFTCQWNACAPQQFSPAAGSSAHGLRAAAPQPLQRRSIMAGAARAAGRAGETDPIHHTKDAYSASPARVVCVKCVVHIKNRLLAATHALHHPIAVPPCMVSTGGH